MRAKVSLVYLRFFLFHKTMVLINKLTFCPLLSKEANTTYLNGRLKGDLGYEEGITESE